MIATFKPCQLAGTIAAPPSKSMAHRYLIGAALSKGISTLSGVDCSQDILASIDCLEALGAKISTEGDTVTVHLSGRAEEILSVRVDDLPVAAEAAARNLKILGVTEHGPGIPGTCNPILFRNFVDAPRNLFGVEMLYGSETNVLNSGKVDLDEKHLNCLDYAIAGIHGLCYEDVGAVRNTDNVVSCMKHPKVKFISHPDANNYPMDYEALVLGAKEFGCALEMNNSSLRKPKLRPGCVENYRKMLPLCMEHGVPVIVNTDAHDPSQVGDFTLARTMLEEIGFDENLILNNDAEKLKAFLLG
mgnify:CR=1 FL=1